MKKKSILPILSAAFLLTAGCGAKETSPQQMVPEAAEPTAEAEAPIEEAAPTEAEVPADETEEDYVTTGGTPWINSELKESIRLKDTFGGKDYFTVYAKKIKEYIRWHLTHLHGKDRSEL